MARPRAIQGEVEKRLLEALGVGAPIRIACGHAGIAESVYYDEVKRNAEFAERATRARHQAAIRNLALIQKAAPEDWRAAAKFLELTFPDDFGRRIEVTGAAGGPVKVATEVSPELLAGAVRILAEGSGQPLDAGDAESIRPALADAEAGGLSHSERAGAAVRRRSRRRED